MSGMRMSVRAASKTWVRIRSRASVAVLAVVTW